MFLNNGYSQQKLGGIMIKLVALLKRKDGLTLEEFSRYWLEKHAPLALKTLPGIKKYVQNHIVDLSSEEPPFDGVAEIWFEDIESYNLYYNTWISEGGKVIREDEARFQDRDKRVRIVVEEKPIK